MKSSNLPGTRFGLLETIEQAQKYKWRCRCLCGGEKIARIYDLINGKTRSCGCLRRQLLSKRNTRHGITARQKFRREYHAWHHAKRRCTLPNHPGYRHYGGRGIQMCDEWLSNFPAFLAHLGPCPLKYSLDRINNNGNYEPGNCRWATRSTQRRNQRPKSAISSPG